MISTVILFLDNLGGGELLVIFLFILLFFGSKNIPNLAKGMGKGIRQFRNAMNDVRSDLENNMNIDEPPKVETKEKKPDSISDQADSKKENPS